MSYKESYFYQSVREVYKESKDKQLKALISKNVDFKNKYAGETCFILGNGPSLKKIDFSLLADKYTFTVNMLPRNPEFSKLKTNFHMWSDERFFDLHEDRPEDMELLEVMKNVNSDGNRPVVFYKYAAKDMVDKYHLDNMLDIHYYEQGWYYLSPNREVDMTKFTPAFSTVVHYLICLAVYMGFKRIVLLGCDCTYIVTIVNTYLNKAEDSLYGYQVSENEKKRMQRVQQQNSVRNELISNLRLFDDYERIYEYCQRRGVELVNASDPTLLDVVPKVRFKDVVK